MKLCSLFLETEKNFNLIRKARMINYFFIYRMKWLLCSTALVNVTLCPQTIVQDL